MKRRIMLDMDGVLCDFDRMVDEHQMRKPNGKCDWQKIRKEMGSQFWSEMEWMPHGEEFYEAVKKFCQEHGLTLGICSAIFLKCGVDGKEEWLSYHCPDVKAEDIIIADKGINKWRHLQDSDILIDDNKDNVDLHIKAHPDSRGIVFKDAKSALIHLDMILSDDREFDKLCEDHDKMLENS